MISTLHRERSGKSGVQFFLHTQHREKISITQPDFALFSTTSPAVFTDLDKTHEKQPLND